MPLMNVSMSSVNILRFNVLKELYTSVLMAKNLQRKK